MKKLSPIQRARMQKNMKSKDEVKKIVKIDDINSMYREEQKLGIINILYKCNDGFIIEDTFYFKEDNPNGIVYNLDRLERFLQNFKIKLKDDEIKNVGSIENSIKQLIGKRVVITTQYKSSGKTECIISSVLNGGRNGKR